MKKLFVTALASFLSLMAAFLILSVLNKYFLSAPRRFIIFSSIFFGTQIVSVIMHELGHGLQLKRYASKVKFDIEIFGIFGFTKSEYFRILEKKAAEDNKEYQKQIKYIALSGPISQTIFNVFSIILAACVHLKIEMQDIIFTATLLSSVISIGSLIIQLITGDGRYFKNPQNFKYQLQDCKKYKNKINGNIVMIIVIAALFYIK